MRLGDSKSCRTHTMCATLTVSSTGYFEATGFGSSRSNLSLGDWWRQVMEFSQVYYCQQIWCFGHISFWVFGSAFVAAAKSKLSKTSANEADPIDTCVRPSRPCMPYMHECQAAKINSFVDLWPLPTAHYFENFHFRRLVAFFFHFLCLVCRTQFTASTYVRGYAYPAESDWSRCNFAPAVLINMKHLSFAHDNRRLGGTWKWSAQPYWLQNFHQICQQVFNLLGSLFLAQLVFSFVCSFAAVQSF